MSDLVDLVDLILWLTFRFLPAPVDISSLCAYVLENLLSVYLTIRVPSMLSTKSQLSQSQAFEGFRTSMVFSIKSWPVLTFDREAAALKSRNKVLCKTFFEELIVTVQSTKSLSHDQLFFRVPTRNLEAESEVSVYSYITGNCLYSCVSLVLVGNNYLTKPFRILTSWELFPHANFYSKHRPVFYLLFLNIKMTFTSVLIIFF